MNIDTQKIEKYIQDNGISITDFCKRCKISFSTYKKIMNNESNFGIIALFKIARVLNIQICDLFCD